MSQVRNNKERIQRFKIEVIKKKVKRLHNTPQQQLLKTEYGVQKLIQNKLSTRGKADDQDKNPEDLASIVFKHTQVKSELSHLYQENLFSFPEFQMQQGRESIIINSIPHRHFLKYSDQSFDQPDFRFSRIDKKLSDQKKTRHQQRYKFNPFESLNVVKCQSITLIQASRKNKADLRPQKYLARKQGSSSAKKIRLTVASSSKIMNFNLSTDTDSIYMKKLKAYLDFLFKVNYSNKMFLNIDLKQSEQVKKYKMYVGWGNNHQLVKSCLRSRFWIEIIDKPEDSEVKFYWTSWPVREYYQKQKDHIKRNEYYVDLSTRGRKFDNETLRYNQKILSGRQAMRVQNFITSDGYIIPFSESFSPATMTNHLSGSCHISQKKKLFHSLFHYYHSCLKTDPFSVVPITYNVVSLEDPEYKRFMRDNEGKKDKIWIVKPGEDTNRGEGISLAATENVAQYIVEGFRQSYVIQSYIGRPLLYNGRKFDVRHFFLVTSINGHIKAYWFKQGYIRTSSEPFDLENLTQKFIHLTNDAIQQHSKNYGMYEPANKVSYRQFERYLQTILPKRHINFQTEILDKVKEIISNVIKANYKSLDRKQKQANFELFGIDFMIDRDLRPWLIEINENPCLETNCQLLSRLIPSLLENTLRLCLDPLFPPLNHFPPKLRSSLNDHFLKTLKFQLIFDQQEYEKLSLGRTSSF